jgi:hypothetical protein
MKVLEAISIVPIALSLCQCAVNDDRVSALLVAPTGEQYQFYSCTQLVAEMKKIKTAQAELKSRMVKGGTVASVVGGYKVDYAEQHGRFVAARNTARDKKCEVPADVAVEEPL